MSLENTITLHEWLQRATLEQRNAFYSEAQTSRRSIWQAANGHRGITANRAAQIERATLAIHAEHPELPPILRTSTCAACAECPYAKKCGAV